MVKFRGDVRADRPRGRRRRVEVLRHDRKRLAFREGRLAGQQRVQHAAQRIQVAALVDLLSPALLGGHVSRRADGLASGRELGGGINGPGQSCRYLACP